MRKFRGCEISSPLKKPSYLSFGHFSARIYASISFTFCMYALIEEMVAIRSVVPSALAIRNSLCVAFESLADRTASYG